MFLSNYNFIIFQHEGAWEGHGPAADWHEGVRARGGVLPRPGAHHGWPLPPRHEGDKYFYQIEINIDTSHDAGVHDHGPGQIDRAGGSVHRHEGQGELVELETMVRYNCWLERLSWDGYDSYREVTIHKIVLSVLKIQTHVFLSLLIVGKWLLTQLEMYFSFVSKRHGLWRAPWPLSLKGPSGVNKSVLMEDTEF